MSVRGAADENRTQKPGGLRMSIIIMSSKQLIISKALKQEDGAWLQLPRTSDVIIINADKSSMWLCCRSWQVQRRTQTSEDETGSRSKCSSGADGKAEARRLRKQEEHPGTAAHLQRDSRSVRADTPSPLGGNLHLPQLGV